MAKSQTELRLKIAARDSQLSQIQVHELMKLLPDIAYEPVFMASQGDKDLKRSLQDPKLPADFFTKELDDYLFQGLADISVHSAKDLPHPLPDGLEVIALGPCLDPTDALYSPAGLRLSDLPSGARIATSSTIRKQQISAVREDIEIVDIRGTIAQRIEQVKQGAADAVVIATCALKRLGLEDHITEVLDLRTFPLQGNLAVVAMRNRLDLKALFASVDIRKAFGKVFLLGFGPGDPELMTLKTDRILRQSEIIFYDDLIDQTVLDNYSARKVYVGKRKGCPYQSQDEINELLKEAAYKGLQVARLKGGDPGIFGRVGEEAEFLQLNMIPYEIVPGVTSAMAAGAGQNISMTYRKLSRSFSFLTAHHADVRNIDVPDVHTIVYYMAASQLEALSKRLIEKGRAEDEPVLLVQNATFPDERSELCTVGTMADSSLSSPLIVIVGHVAEKRQKSAKMLYTGLHAEHVRSPLKVVSYPLIQVQALEDVPEPKLSEFQGVIFTSQNAVKYFQGWDELAGKTIVAIGGHTKRALQSKGVNVDYMPEVEDSIHLSAWVKEQKESFFYPCSALSSNALHELENVHAQPIYQTEFLKPKAVDLNNFSEVYFTSPSTVKAFFEIYEQMPVHIVCRVQGAITSEALKAKGIADVQIVVGPPGRYIQRSRIAVRDDDSAIGNRYSAFDNNPYVENRHPGRDPGSLNIAERLPFTRMRHLRKDQETRDKHAQILLKPEDFIMPYFVVEGQNICRPIPSLEGVNHYSVDRLLEELKSLEQTGISKVLLFGAIPEAYKDEKGSHSHHPETPVVKAVQAIKHHFPKMTVMTDVCICGYTHDGHCGLVEGHEVLNDPSLEILAKMALAHAQAGADYVAPSSMMDGQVWAIRQKLDEQQLQKVQVLSYSVKYASHFYGPFRDAVSSSPSFGDRKTYQMDFRNADQAMQEVRADLKEGASAVMVKPAHAYLDVLAEIAKTYPLVPLAAYHVSGEYMMVKHAAKAGALDANQAFRETLTAMKRAGANWLISYAAKDLCSYE